MSDSEKKGYVVRDRRRMHVEAEEAAPRPAAEAPMADATRRDAPAAPPPPEGSRAVRGAAEAVDFSSLVLSVATNAMIALGATGPEDRIPGRPNLAAAAQNIEILIMLEEKTRGNLTPEEAELMQSVLYDLKMQYVTVAQAAR